MGECDPIDAMTRSAVRRHLCLAGCGLLVAMQAVAQGESVINVTNSPRAFSVIAPESWTLKSGSMNGTGVRVVAPSGKHSAECSVMINELEELKKVSQADLEQKMAGALNPKQFAEKLSSRYRNARVFSTGTTSISGYSSLLANVQYGVGTSNGEKWVREIMAITTTTPGLVWTISCSAWGKSLDEAEKNYAYWQSAMARFPFNLKIR